jgi:hypothetical protein
LHHSFLLFAPAGLVALSCGERAMAPQLFKDIAVLFLPLDRLVKFDRTVTSFRCRGGICDKHCNELTDYIVADSWWDVYRHFKAYPGLMDYFIAKDVKFVSSVWVDEMVRRKCEVQPDEWLLKIEEEEPWEDLIVSIADEDEGFRPPCYQSTPELGPHNIKALKEEYELACAELLNTAKEEAYRERCEVQARKNRAKMERQKRKWFDPQADDWGTP